jgi:hypothetical protein
MRKKLEKSAHPVRETQRMVEAAKVLCPEYVEELELAQAQVEAKHSTRH